ncbi:cell division protein FtsL [Candidatus Poribacteria bacterium]|nr:cell division protein FtsL [Candidatus Poribacteria bacterium]
MAIDSNREVFSNLENKLVLRGFLIFVAIVVVFSFLLLQVWLPSKAVQIAYDVEQLAKQEKALKEQNTNLALDIARLRAPERIEAIATTELNMVKSINKPIILER